MADGAEPVVQCGALQAIEPPAEVFATPRKKPPGEVAGAPVGIHLPLLRSRLVAATMYSSEIQMQAIRRLVKVEANGEIRLGNVRLAPGAEVEVIVLVESGDTHEVPQGTNAGGLAAFYGRGRGLGFVNAEEADRSLCTERDAWGE